MSPSTNNTGMELPPPVVEQSPQPDIPVETNQTSIEKQHAPSREQTSGSNAGVQALPPLTIPLPTASPPPTRPPIQIGDVPVSDTKLIQDKDLIEKEWVNKAKAIVEKNRDDPFQQSEDLTMLRADYMKKQFNKTIKLNK